MLGVYAVADRDYMVGIAGALSFFGLGGKLEGCFTLPAPVLRKHALGCCSAEDRTGPGRHCAVSCPPVAAVVEEGCFSTIVSAGCYTSLLHMCKQRVHLFS